MAITPDMEKRFNGALYGHGAPALTGARETLASTHIPDRAEAIGTQVTLSVILNHLRDQYPFKSLEELLRQAQESAREVIPAVTSHYEKALNAEVISPPVSPVTIREGQPTPLATRTQPKAEPLITGGPSISKLLYRAASLPLPQRI